MQLYLPSIWQAEAREGCRGECRSATRGSGHCPALPAPHAHLLPRLPGCTPHLSHRELRPHPGHLADLPRLSTWICGRRHGQHVRPVAAGRVPVQRGRQGAVAAVCGPAECPLPSQPAKCPLPSPRAASAISARPGCMPTRRDCSSARWVGGLAGEPDLHLEAARPLLTSLTGTPRLRPPTPQLPLSARSETHHGPLPPPKSTHTHAVLCYDCPPFHALPSPSCAFIPAGVPRGHVHRKDRHRLAGRLPSRPCGQLRRRCRQRRLHPLRARHLPGPARQGRMQGA